MNVVYALSKGMKTQELLTELHGKTQGENQRERALMFADWEKEQEVIVGSKHENINGYDLKVNRTLPKAQVVMEYPGNYALILEYHIADNDIRKGTAAGSALPVTDSMPVSDVLVKKGGLVKKFYLAGINDEGLYFVRPLQGIPISKIRDIDALIGWLNKSDALLWPSYTGIYGYKDRVQGDILLMFVPYKSDGVQNKQFKKNMIGKVTHVSYRLPKNGNNKGFTDWYHVSSSRLPKHLSFGDHVIDIAKNLNGHIAQPHMTGFFAIEPLVVDIPDGGTFTMTHSEHGKKTIEVPKDHYAVLASQRGRDEITGHGVFD